METPILKEMPARIPFDGTFELTIRCNLRCKMCLFRHEESENKDLVRKELTAEQWISLGKQVAEAGTLHLLITGGEPMMRPDFCQIWEGLYQQGFFLQLYTNATMVTPKIMNTLKKYPPHQIGVTIYGASEEVYRKVCGYNGAFQKMLEGVKKLQELPSIMDYRTTIIRDNYEDLDNMEKLISEIFHDSQTLTQTQMVMKAVRGGCADVEACRLTPKQNVDLFFRRSMNKVEEIVGKDQFDRKCVEFKIDPKKKARKEKWTLFGCNAGMRAYTITYDGKLLGCQILGEFSEEVMKHGFQKAWDHYPFLIGKRKERKKCQECKDSLLCWSCPASRYAETGTCDDVDDYICSTTREYAKYVNVTK